MTRLARRVTWPAHEPICHRIRRQIEALHSPTIELYPLIGIPIYFLSFLGLFIIRSAIWGVPQAERIKKYESKVMPRFFLEYGYWMLQMQVKVSLTLRFSANAVTVLSLISATAGAVYIGMGRLRGSADG